LTAGVVVIKPTIDKLHRILKPGPTHLKLFLNMNDDGSLVVGRCMIADAVLFQLENNWKRFLSQEQLW
jgi:hypothetical protein